MHYILHNGKTVAEVVSESAVINTVQDALDCMADAYANGAERILVYHTNLNPEFFKLKTGFAGAVLQKFSNYNMKLAVTGDVTRFPSRSLASFITESNRGSSLFFMPDRESALEALTRQ